MFTATSTNSGHGDAVSFNVEVEAHHRGADRVHPICFFGRGCGGRVRPPTLKHAAWPGVRNAPTLKEQYSPGTMLALEYFPEYSSHRRKPKMGSVPTLSGSSSQAGAGPYMAPRGRHVWTGAKHTPCPAHGSAYSA